MGFYLKFLNKEECHYGLQYGEGWFEAPVFNNLPCMNGIHYTHTDTPVYYQWIRDLYNITHFREVLETVDQIEYSYDYKFKARKVRLGPVKRPLTDLFVDVKLQKSVVGIYPDLFRYFTNPPEEIQLSAISYLTENVKYIKDPSDQVQLAALRHGRKAIAYIGKPKSESVEVMVIKSCSPKYLKVNEFAQICVLNHYMKVVYSWDASDAALAAAWKKGVKGDWRSTRRIRRARGIAQRSSCTEDPAATSG